MILIFLGGGGSFQNSFCAYDGGDTEQSIFVKGEYVSFLTKLWD